MTVFFGAIAVATHLVNLIHECRLLLSDATIGAETEDKNHAVAFAYCKMASSAAMLLTGFSYISEQ